MEKESNISLGGTIILLALFAQNYILTQRYILSRSSDPVSHLKTKSKVQKVSFSHFQGIIIFKRLKMFARGNIGNLLYEKGINKTRKSQWRLLVGRKIWSWWRSRPNSHFQKVSMLTYFGTKSAIHTDTLKLISTPRLQINFVWYIFTNVCYALHEIRSRLLRTYLSQVKYGEIRWLMTCPT